MAIDGSGHVELSGEGGQGGYGAMGDGANGEGFGPMQPGEEIMEYICNENNDYGVAGGFR